MSKFTTLTFIQESRVPHMLEDGREGNMFTILLADSLREDAQMYIFETWMPADEETFGLAPHCQNRFMSLEWEPMSGGFLRITGYEDVEVYND